MAHKRHPLTIYPSLLAADPLQLGAAMERMQQAGVDGFHIDGMDGHFVPNIAFGPASVVAICRASRLPVQVHLMMEPNAELLAAYLQAKPHTVTIHPEPDQHIEQSLQQIQKAGCQCGLALHPHTSVQSIRHLLPLLGQVLIMSVVPGFAGQAFLPEVLDKLAQLRQLRQTDGLSFQLAIDGGINAQTAARAVAMGAEQLISGSYLLQASEPAQAVATLRAGVA